VPTKTATKESAGFSEEEKAAARARVQELKQTGDDREQGLRDVLNKLADMPEPDRSMGQRIHELVQTTAPELWPRTYYGMPAYATPGKNGKTICWFKPKSKFKVRYATIEFGFDAKLDDGKMWPVSWAIIELTPQTESQIKDLLRKAIG